MTWLTWPVATHWPVSQEFGEIDHVLYSEYNGRHNGVDVACNTGTPVVAAADGEIVHLGSDPARPARGFHMILLHRERGCETHYLHMSTLLGSVGDMVRAGQEIGASGATGGVAAHLHWGLRDLAQLASETKGFVDPVPYVQL